METKDAIRRLTNLAQEKNANWLGLTNIEAMEVVLERLKNKSEDYKSLSIMYDEEITEKNNEICDLEFKVENRDKLINKLIFRIATIEGKDFEDIKKEYE